MKAKVTHDLQIAWVVRLFTAVFLGFFVLRSLADVSGNLYDWDIDHEMYFGTRLLRGELLYTQEYHDKLPLVQYLFALPAVLKNVRVWIAGSIILSMIAAFAMRMSLIIMINGKEERSSNNLRNAIAGCGASCYLFLIAILPGSLSHINPAAANMGILSVYFLLRASYSKGLRSYACMYSLASICGAAAISIRPYLAPAVVLLGIWMPARAAAINKASIQSENLYIQSSSMSAVFISIARHVFLWVATLIIFGIIVNIIPYLFTDSVLCFIDGIRHNAQSLNPQSLKGTLISQAQSFTSLGGLVTAVTAFSVLMPIALMVRRLPFAIKKHAGDSQMLTSEIDLIFSGFVPLLLIEITILSRHYWPHYQQLFASYIAFSFALSLYFLVSQNLIHVRLSVPPMFMMAFLAAFIMVISIPEIKVILSALRSLNAAHPQEIVLDNISNVVLERKRLGLDSDFLHTSHMYSHWRLDEPRHGFPHAANFGHIENDWWLGLDREKSIDFPYNEKQLCEKLKVDGPTIIFASVDAQINQCLASINSIYNELDLPSLSSPGLKVFARN